MGEWAITMSVAEKIASERRYRALRRFPNALIQAALVMDLTTRQVMVLDQSRFTTTAARTQFPPADAVLDAVAEGASDVAQLIWGTYATVRDVQAAFISKGWWEPEPRARWRKRDRYRPSSLAEARVRDPRAEQLAELMVSLLSASTDTDEVEQSAKQLDFAAPSPVAAEVFHELIQLRSWLQAAATTPSNTG